MISATRFGTRDLEKAASFYDAIAALIGVKRSIERPDMIGYKGADGATFVIGTPFDGAATVGNGSQVVMAAPSRAIVDAVYAKALEMGGSCEGKPGIRGDDPNGFYGAYFRDLDGNKLVIHRFGAPDA